jgi:hypothetical protein
MKKNSKEISVRIYSLLFTERGSMIQMFAFLSFICVFILRGRKYQNIILYSSKDCCQKKNKHN